MEDFAIEWKAETGSTNSDARGAAAWTVVAADWQSAGRGRLDHRWVSPKGVNLAFSAVLPVGDRDVAEASTLPLVIGLAVVSALRRFAPAAVELKLKWPNDVLADGRKLCGILCERDGDNVIAGVGVNVNLTEFPPELAARATSLALLNERPLDRREVFSAALESLRRYFTSWHDDGFASLLGEFAAVDALKGREVSVRRTDDDRSPARGICRGVSPSGALLVGEEEIFSGEAHVEHFGA